MSKDMKVDTDRVEEIANDMATLIEQFNNSLETDKTAMKRLDTWTGKSAERVKPAFKNFVKNNYPEEGGEGFTGTFVNFVAYLMNNVVMGYEIVEYANIGDENTGEVIKLEFD
ncbi:MAG: hypothetical protein FWG40_10370 [Peptococcaceae bacterium]|nr:hypothetical protein [Peptococcaceae bacterium]